MPGEGHVSGSEKRPHLPGVPREREARKDTILEGR